MKIFQFHLLRMCLFVGIMMIGAVIATIDNTLLSVLLGFLGAGLMDLYCENSFTFHLNPGDKVLLNGDKRYGLEISAQIIDGEALGGIVLKKQ